MKLKETTSKKYLNEGFKYYTIIHTATELLECSNTFQAIHQNKLKECNCEPFGRWNDFVNPESDLVSDGVKTPHWIEQSQKKFRDRRRRHAEFKYITSVFGSKTAVQRFNKHKTVRMYFGGEMFKNCKTVNEAEELLTDDYVSAKLLMM